MFTIYFKLGNYGKNIKTFILPQTNFNEFLRLLKMKDTPDAQKSFLRRDLSTLMATINFKLLSARKMEKYCNKICV